MRGVLTGDHIIQRQAGHRTEKDCQPRVLDRHDCGDEEGFVPNLGHGDHQRGSEERLRQAGLHLDT